MYVVNDLRCNYWLQGSSLLVSGGSLLLSLTVVRVSSLLTHVRGHVVALGLQHVTH